MNIQPREILHPSLNMITVLAAFIVCQCNLQAQEPTHAPEEQVESPKFISKEAISKRLESLIVPTVKFRDAKIADVLATLVKDARLVGREDEQVDLGFEILVARPTNEPITIECSSIPLQTILNYVCNLSGCSYKFVPGAIVVTSRHSSYVSYPVIRSIRISTSLKKDGSVHHLIRFSVFCYGRNTITIVPPSVSSEPLKWKTVYLDGKVIPKGKDSSDPLKFTVGKEKVYGLGIPKGMSTNTFQIECVGSTNVLSNPKGEFTMLPLAFEEAIQIGDPEWKLFLPKGIRFQDRTILEVDDSIKKKIEIEIERENHYTRKIRSVVDSIVLTDLDFGAATLDEAINRVRQQIDASPSVQATEPIDLIFSGPHKDEQIYFASLDDVPVLDGLRYLVRTVNSELVFGPNAIAISQATDPFSRAQDPDLKRKLSTIAALIEPGEDIKGKADLSAITKTLEETLIPQVNFDETDIYAALEFLSSETERVWKEKEIRKSFNYVLSGPKRSFDPLPTMTMKLSEPVSLKTLLVYVCNLSGLQFEVEKHAVLITPKSIPRAPRITEIFEYPGLAEWWDTTSDIGLRGSSALQLIQKSGLFFQSGCSAVYNPLTGRLVVRQTEDNLRLIEGWMNSMHEPVDLFPRSVIPFEIPSNSQELRFSGPKAKEMITLEYSKASPTSESDE